MTNTRLPFKTPFCKTAFLPLNHLIIIQKQLTKKIPTVGAFPFAFLDRQSIINTAMQCEHCDNKATVFYTQIIDGIGKKTCLCESCASEQGITDPEGFLLGSQDIQKQGDSSEHKALTSKKQAAWAAVSAMIFSEKK
jgi:hypothetical protein